ncbi:hypothetical protein LX36DRAFT_675650 [Colletotrichum falcatum]|nr:hypothetical protein LX36DRAFT_675650 [Colletotrichum falcatum]
MAKFSLFGLLPAELRLEIWRTTLELKDFVANYLAICVATPAQRIRTRLPVISAVNRESRSEFLRIVSLSLADAELGAPFWTGVRPHCGVVFLYSRPYGRVYFSEICMRLPCGMSLGFYRPWARFVVRIDLSDQDPDGPTGGWVPLKKGSPRYSLWRVSAEYVALRLGEDRSRG